MNKKRKSKDFCCPEFVPPGALDDFCIPEDCCPQRLKTPKFPSPTSCLPEEQTRRLEEKIDTVNELLLDLALSNERPEEGRMKSIEGLIGQLIEVKIDCEEPVEEKNPELNEDGKKITQIEHTHLVDPDLDKTLLANREKRKKRKDNTGKYKKRKKRVNKVGKKIYAKRKVIVNKQDVSTIETGDLKGFVRVIGRDFVLLKRNKEEIIIPLTKISLIKPHDRFAQPIHKPELLDIDPCLRRALTFDFGETVASSPELIEIFFKLTLPNFLLIHLDKKVKIKVADEEIEGILMEINKDSLVISMKNEKLRIIPLLSVCFIII